MRVVWWWGGGGVVVYTAVSRRGKMAWQKLCVSGWNPGSNSRFADRQPGLAATLYIIMKSVTDLHLRQRIINSLICPQKYYTSSRLQSEGGN